MCVLQCFEGFWCIPGLPILSDQPDKLPPPEAAEASVWTSKLKLQNLLQKLLPRLLAAMFDGLSLSFLHREAKYEESLHRTDRTNECNRQKTRSSS